MQSLAMTHQCFALNLPGHGRSKVDSQGMSMQEAAVIMTVAVALNAYACLAHFKLCDMHSGMHMHAETLACVSFLQTIAACAC